MQHQVIPPYVRSGLSAAILSVAGACGGWVKNYDLSPNWRVVAAIDVAHNRELIDAICSFADRHEMECIRKDLSYHTENAFHIMLRNRMFSVGALNYPNEQLNVSFYLAVDPKRRPTATELAVLVKDFKTEISSVAGVTAINDQAP